MGRPGGCRRAARGGLGLELAILVAVLALAGASASDEVLVPLPFGGHVGLSTRGPSAFRMRVLFEERLPIDSVFIGPTKAADAPFHEVSVLLGKGIRASFGMLVVTSRGTIALLSPAGHLLTESQPLNPGSCAGIPNMRPQGGESVGAKLIVSDEGSCCRACSNTPGCADWAFAAAPNGSSCWLGRAAGWARAPGSVAGRSGSVLSLSTRGARLYGRGAAPSDAAELLGSAASAHMVNRGTYVPYYWSSDGYAALGVVDASRHNAIPVSYSSDGRRISWAYDGGFELYLMPAESLAQGTRAYFQLTGSPRVPPLYAFGFMASRWGWRDRADVVSTLAAFRSGRFPLDAIIMDFEWFANQSDYDFTPEGKEWYDDFGYNEDVLPVPREQLAGYHDEFHVRVGAIRKPRLGNPSHLETARSNGWIAPPGGPETYAEGRWVSFTEPAMRKWYGERNAHYLSDGIDFWWNDEGENQYYKYYWWNVAQIEMLRTSQRPNRRFYSLNRAFIPGMARLGATVWTGDISSTWTDLAKTPGMMLNWGLAGAPYVACDIGGFHGVASPTLLTRWYQLGVFLPTMRVHSTHSVTPHWPWLFGDREAGVMRSALELRYRLVPYHYSLAHAMYRRHELWMRPLAMDFPHDENVADLSVQWMDGQILVAPVLRKDSRREVYLPEGLWYELGTPASLRGPARLEGRAALEDLPAFVRSGAVLPLAPAAQHTGALPGGPLEVQVYGGRDGAFELVADDGESAAYEEGLVHVTRLAWDEEGRTLSWTTEGEAGAAGARSFAELFVTLFEPGGAQRSPVRRVSGSGSVMFPEGQAGQQRGGIKRAGGEGAPGTRGASNRSGSRKLAAEVLV